jgi:hypothetical protein
MVFEPLQVFISTHEESTRMLQGWQWWYNSFSRSWLANSSYLCVGTVNMLQIDNVHMNLITCVNWQFEIEKLWDPLKKPGPTGV